MVRAYVIYSLTIVLVSNSYNMPGVCLHIGERQLSANLFLQLIVLQLVKRQMAQCRLVQQTLSILLKMIRQLKNSIETLESFVMMITSLIESLHVMIKFKQHGTQ